MLQTGCGMGAAVWDLDINKGCYDTNSQLVLDHSGSVESGGRGQERGDYAMGMST